MRKKQIVAISGVVLILFVMAHLAGNLTFFAGPETFNAYAFKLKKMGWLLRVFESGLFAAFVTHIVFTVSVVWDSYRARHGFKRYHMIKPHGDEIHISRWVSLSALVLFIFLIVHLRDFTSTSHEGPQTLLPSGEAAGLYGLVANTLSRPWHALFYCAAMIALGVHLHHGLKSVFQTLGCESAAQSRILDQCAKWVAWGISLGFASIPLFCFLWWSR